MIGASFWNLVAVSGDRGKMAGLTPVRTAKPARRLVKTR